MHCPDLNWYGEASEDVDLLIKQILCSAHTLFTYCHKSVKGSNMIPSTVTTIGCYCLPDPDVDMSIVYAVPKGNHIKGAPLILLCFHKKSQHNSSEWIRKM